MVDQIELFTVFANAAVISVGTGTSSDEAARYSFARYLLQGHEMLQTGEGYTVASQKNGKSVGSMSLCRRSGPVESYF